MEKIDREMLFALHRVKRRFETTTLIVALADKGNTVVIIVKSD